MRWRVVVRPEIEDDLTNAADWYDLQEEGLGDRFINEVIEVFDRLGLRGIKTAHPHVFVA